MKNPRCRGHGSREKGSRWAANDDQRGCSTPLGGVDGGVSISGGDPEEEGFPEGVYVVVVVAHLVSGVIDVEKDALGNSHPALGNPLIRYLTKQGVEASPNIGWVQFDPFSTI